jgi:hypothetical protein
MIPWRRRAPTEEERALTSATSRVFRTTGLLLGFVVLAALPAVGLGAYAAADSGPPTTTDRGGGAVPGGRPALSDEQRQCLADHGVTLPTPTERGSVRQPPSAADRDALRAAAEACGLPLRVPRAGSRII